MVSNLNISDIKSYAIEKRKEFIDYYWLGLGDVNKIKTTNKIAAHELFKENPMLAVIDLMRKPENFAWTCKVLFNKIIAPYQAVILKELWNHPFPLLIGSRGLSKSFCLALYALLKALFNPGSKIILTGAAFRQAKIIFNYCETIWKESRMLQDILSFDKSNRPLHGTDEHVFKIDSSQIIAIPTGCLSGDSLITLDSGIYNLIDIKDKYHKVWSNGEYRDIGYFWDNGIKETLKVTTKFGYQYIGTLNHKMKVCRNNEIIWVESKDVVVGDRILIDRTERWHNSDTTVTIDESYCLGLMLGDGNYTNPYSLRYTTIDKEFVEVLNNNIGVFRPESDGLHYNLCGKNIVSNWLNYWNIKPLKSHEKYMPERLLCSSKDKVRACIQGLFDTDGYVRMNSHKSGISGNIGYTTTSLTLAKQIHYLLLHFGIVADLSFRDRLSHRTGNPAKRAYDINITGQNMLLFYHRINFRLTRKREILQKIINEKKRWFSIYDNIPFNTSLSDKSILHSRKVLTFDRLNKFLDSDIPLSLQLLNNKNYYYDIIESVENNGFIHTYDIHVPDNNEYCANGFFSHNTGENIRGKRGNCLIVDEFNSINVQVFEEIMQGFNAVKSNPIQAMIEYHKLLALKDIGEISEDEFLEERSKMSGNQTIISGTCGYTFEHLYKYFKDYHDIITNKDNKVKLEKLFGSDNLGISSKDFSIIRMPYKLIPPGVMDEKTILKAKATSNTSIFQSEFEACFLSDTSGFFKRSLIQKCTCGKSLVPFIKKCGEVEFNILTEGHRDLHYVMGVDPASESDNFAIVILELHEDHRRIVYAWTTNNATHKAKLRYRLIDDNDYYRYCARKIRDLMIQFNIKEISIDAQGGGKAIMEVLGDPKYLVNNEKPLYPIPDLDKPRLSDNLAGLHILRPIEFSNANWVYDANHNLKQDMETTELLFPLCDSLAFGMLHEQDKLENKLKAGVDMEIDKLIETAEDVLLEVEELKNELVIIEHSKTPNGRDRWDTPQIKGLNQKKGRLRKDRYSALLLANASGRAMIARTVEYEYNIFGGFTKDVAKVVKNEKTIGNISMVEEGFSYGGGVFR